MSRNRISQHSYKQFVLIGLLAFFLSGCVSLADPETSQVHQQDVIYTLFPDSQDWIGQTFESRRGGLNSITIYTAYPSDDTMPPPILIIELYHFPAEDQPTFSTRLAARNGAIKINLPPQRNAPYTKYLLKLYVAGQGVQLMGRNEDIYPPGEVYANGELLTGDLAFSTTYEYGLSAFLIDLKDALPNSSLALPLFAVLFVPGFFLFCLLGAKNDFDLGELVALSVGLSLAVLPLAMLWTGLVGLSWGRSAVVFSGAILALGSIALFWRKKAWQGQQPDIVDIALVIIFAASLVIRLIMIRDMAGTAWIDSVHHGLVTSLILEQGTLPASFLPFFDIAPTDYHPGFHVGVAAFTWLSQLDMDRAMLLFGQVLNALTVFAVYLFTKTLTHSKLAGLFAALAVGLCTPMPVYYTTWGRYTQLAGTLILPIPLSLFQKSMENELQSWRNLTLACLAAAGLILVHYRVMAFLTILMGLYYLIYFMFDRSKWQLLPRASLSALICTLAVALLAIPWLVPTLSTTILPLERESTESVKWFSDFSWRLLNTALGQEVMSLAVFGLVAGLLLRNRLGVLTASWITALFLLANPTKLGLSPSILNNTSVAIFLFLPISALTGYAIDLVKKAWFQLAPKLLRPFMVGLTLAGLIVGYQGSLRILPILNSGTILLRQADIPALHWAKENLPTEAIIAINPFLWGYGLYAGSDGGFWLTPIAGLRTMPPPVLSSMGEWKENTELSKRIIEYGRDSANLADLLRKNNIQYIYLGRRGGAISPATLRSDPQYDVLYQADGVWIFKLTD